MFREEIIRSVALVSINQENLSIDAEVDLPCLE